MLWTVIGLTQETLVFIITDFVNLFQTAVPAAYNHI